MNPIALTPAQRKKLEDLINSGRIRRVPVDLAKADRFIAQSRDALTELPSIKNPQLRYDGGYNAAQADATVTCAEDLLRQAGEHLH